jgi:hypothetical protein
MKQQNLTLLPKFQRVLIVASIGLQFLPGGLFAQNAVLPPITITMPAADTVVDRYPVPVRVRLAPETEISQVTIHINKKDATALFAPNGGCHAKRGNCTLEASLSVRDELKA